MYDIIFITQSLIEDNESYFNLKQRFPTTKIAKTFDEAKKKCLTRFFWLVPDDVIIDKNFDFSYVVDEWSQDFIHVFKNKELWNGVALFPKKSNTKENELSSRSYTNIKQVDIIASNPKPYDIFEIDNYDEYLSALKNSSTEMFWMSSRNITAIIPDLYFTHDNTYDRKQNHAFIHQVGDKRLYNGLFLCSKYVELNKNEIETRVLNSRKEWDIVASKLKPYDIVFISYQEPNADENYNQIQKRFPTIKRIHGVKGIHQAHIAAAKLCTTDMIWIVDGDANVMEDFDFSYVVPEHQLDHIHVWRSLNPINDLVYGYGGIKLFPRLLTISMDTSRPDMTTSISTKFKAINKISNITAFNTDPFNTWKSAFRECVKLSSKIIDRQNDDETLARLLVWKTVGADREFGKYAIDGATQGELFGISQKDNIENIKLINDFNWLRKKFDEQYS